MPSQMGRTDGVGVIVYTGTRDELCQKLRDRDDRITELEAAIRSITYEDDGRVYASKRDHIDLAGIAPILLTVHQATKI